MGTYMILVGAFFQHLFGIHGLSEVGKDEGLPVISNFKWGFPSRKRIKSKDPPNTLRHVAFSSCGKETITIIAQYGITKKMCITFFVPNLTIGSFAITLSLTSIPSQNDIIPIVLHFQATLFFNIAVFFLFSDLIRKTRFSRGPW